MSTHLYALASCPDPSGDAPHRRGRRVLRRLVSRVRGHAGGGSPQGVTPRPAGSPGRMTPATAGAAEHPVHGPAGAGPRAAH